VQVRRVLRLNSVGHDKRVAQSAAIDIAEGIVETCIVVRMVPGIRMTTAIRTPPTLL
jgi:hypothetical protein